MRADALVVAIVASIGLIGGVGPAWAYTVYVSNEKGNSITVLDSATLEVKETIPVGNRPRGITLTNDDKYLLICASDEDAVQVLDVNSHELVGDLPSGPDPELLDLHPSGNPVYVANEDDNLLTVIDINDKKVLAEVEVGVEPEGVGASPDGKTVVVTSETTNMAHFVDTETYEITDNVLVGSRPRFAEFTADGSRLWVTSEVAGMVSVIDAKTRKIIKVIGFAVPGVQPEQIQPVGVRITKDGTQGLRCAWTRQSRGGDRRQDARGREISAGRAARVAARLHARREAAVRDQRQQQRRLGDRCAKPDRREVDPRRHGAVGRGDLAAVRPQDCTRQRAMFSDARSAAATGSGRSDPFAGDIAEGDRIRIPLGGDPQLVLGVNDQGAMLRAFILGRVFEATQENDFPAAQDDLRECHPTSSAHPEDAL